MMKGKMCTVHMIAMVFVVIGGLNWGLVGVFDFNFISWLFGNLSVVERIVYILVGLSALLMIFACYCKKCGLGGSCCEDGDGACCQDEKKV